MLFTPINRPHSPPPTMDIPYNNVLMLKNMHRKQPVPDCSHTTSGAGAVGDTQQQQTTNNQCTYSKKKKHSKLSDELIDPLVRHGAADARKRQKPEEPSASSVKPSSASSPRHLTEANQSGASPTPVSSAQTTPKSLLPPGEGYAVVVDVTTWYPAATCTFSPGNYATRAEAVERLAQQLEVWSQNNSIPVLPRENWSWNPGHPVSLAIQEQRAWNRDSFRGCVQRAIPGPTLLTLIRSTGPKPACGSCKICERCAMLATIRSDRNMQQICDRCQTKLYHCSRFGSCSQPANTTAPGARPELVYRVAIRRISNGSSIDGLKFYWDLDQANSTLRQLVDESVSSKGRKKEDQEWDRKSIVGIFNKTKDRTMYVENLVDNHGWRVCAYVEPMLVHLELQQQQSGYFLQS